MSYVLDEQKQQQILGLGRVGWPVRRIAAATDVDRATVRGYLRAAGIAVRGRGRPGEGAAKPAISGEVSTEAWELHPHKREVHTEVIVSVQLIDEPPGLRAAR